MIAAQPVSFFMMVLSRASCNERLVSNTVVTMSRNDSVHSAARMTWSYRSEYQPSNSADPAPAVLRRMMVLTTSRMGSTIRRSSTSSLRSR
jgi:hypothetical protein